VISIELLTENLAFLYIVCSVSFKRNEETGQVKGKGREGSPTKLPIAYEEYLKVAPLRKKSPRTPSLK